jgi:hypothetical protein
LISKEVTGDFITYTNNTFIYIWREELVGSSTKGKRKYFKTVKKIIFT